VSTRLTSDSRSLPSKLGRWRFLSHHHLDMGFLRILLEPTKRTAPQRGRSDLPETNEATAVYATCTRSGPGQVLCTILGAAGAARPHPQRNASERYRPICEYHAGGQNPPTCGGPGAGSLSTIRTSTTCSYGFRPGRGRAPWPWKTCVGQSMDLKCRLVGGRIRNFFDDTFDKPAICGIFSSAGCGDGCPAFR